MGSSAFSRSISETGSGAAPLETPRTLERSTWSMPGTWSSATNTGGAPPIEVTRCFTASSTYFTGSKRMWMTVVVPAITIPLR